MKISLTIFYIMTLLVLLCSFEVASKKCKKTENFNAKSKKCVAKKAATKATTAGDATTEAAITTAAA